MKKDLPLRALKQAIILHQPAEGIIHHCDRGSQYCSDAYQQLLEKHGFKISMSGKGNCHDNAAMESFFKTIKAELIWRTIFMTRKQPKREIASYIDGFYNPARRDSARRSLERKFVRLAPEWRDFFKEKSREFGSALSTAHVRTVIEAQKAPQRTARSGAN